MPRIVLTLEQDRCHILLGIETILRVKDILESFRQFKICFDLIGSSSGIQKYLYTFYLLVIITIQICRNNFGWETLVYVDQCFTTSVPPVLSDISFRFFPQYLKYQCFVREHNRRF